MMNRLNGLCKRVDRLQRNSLFRRLLTFGILAFTLGLLAVLLVRGRAELRQITSWTDCWMALGQSFLLYPVSLTIQALTWSMMIGRLAQIARGWHDVEIYAYTHLMRRLPGGVWYLVGRTMVYRELGAEGTATLAASGLEWLLLLLAAGLVWGSIKLFRVTTWWLGAALILGVAAAVLATARWIAAHGAEIQSRLPGFAHRWMEAWSATPARPRAGELALWTGAYAVAYGIGGLILFRLVISLAPAAGVTLPDAVSVWALTGGVASLTSTILPAGLGIRELTLTALLTPEVATTRAVLVALLLRALFIVGDLIWGGTMWGLARAIRRR